MRRIALPFLFILVLLASACGSHGHTTSDRGRYIYDDAERLPTESEIALASYLWRLDEKTDYEIVFVFPKEQLDEDAILARFNKLGVGKKGRDNGAAVFVLPDNSIFVAIGAGNDKVTTPYSKTYGEKIFASLNDDPVLTYLRFASAIGGKVNSSSDNQVATRVYDTIAKNIGVILLWTATIALFLFAAQQVNGFQVYDLILPTFAFVILGIFIGFTALEPKPGSNYATYGVITSEKHSTYDWVEIKEFCVSTGKTTTCYPYPVDHTDYRNDVSFMSYEGTSYGWRFTTTDSKSAWGHHPGELDQLQVNKKDNTLSDTAGVDDFSGGKTVGDGVWIYSGMKKGDKLP
ncbi:MAG TPA: TPM domain-containing protein [Patescibacteria group bacterium]|nr:TPM domain-containing protein [Patescibacteria group bacterium]